MVHFVGAGCGAPDLITVRGAKLLEEADVIVYAGSLVNPELLSYNTRGALIYNSATMTLDEVVDVFKEAAKCGKDVVRLHTGEPSLYGAIREQMDELDALGIEYDITPGVTAAFGAAASFGIEYTLPDISQTLILTRAEGKTLVPELEKISALAAHQASMAIYLSASLAKKVQAALLEGGYKEETPVAIGYKVTWEDEKLYTATVGTLASTMEDNYITKTAIILVGEAVRPSEYGKSRLYAPDFSTEFRKAKVDED